MEAGGYVDGVHVAVIVFALSFVVAGRIQDKVGPLTLLAHRWDSGERWILSVLLHHQPSLPLCVLRADRRAGKWIRNSTPIPVMAKWFPDKRGLAVGLAVGGYGAGSAIFGPLAQLKLIPTYGLPATFRILGVIFFVMTVAGALLLRNPPAGYRPHGWSPAAAKSAALVREFTPGRNAADSHVLPDVGGLCARAARPA